MGKNKKYKCRLRSCFFFKLKVISLLNHSARKTSNDFRLKKWLEILLLKHNNTQSQWSIPSIQIDIIWTTTKIIDMPINETKQWPGNPRKHLLNSVWIRIIMMTIIIIIIIIMGQQLWKFFLWVAQKWKLLPLQVGKDGESEERNSQSNVVELASQNCSLHLKIAQI